jgi:hypothetical protein
MSEFIILLYKLTEDNIMKKITAISALLVSVLALSSCATTDSDTSAPNSDTVKNTSTETKTPTARVDLTPNGDKLVAKIYTTYNNNPEGSVRLQWDAPKGTGCYDTSFPISKYGETKDMTTASVSLKQGNKFCSGTWNVNVLFDKKIIATSSVEASK